MPKNNRIILFVSSFIIWGLLNWVWDWENILIGVLVAFLVTFLTADFFDEHTRIFLRPRRYFYFIFYFVPVFIWECFKANLNVAYRVIHPNLPINPGIVKVRTKLKIDVALTLLSNAITLTPGTLVVDIDKTNGILYVHWLDVKSDDIETATKHIVERFEKILVKIFQ
jgi:multicomponent Na+:H+ antiporter subunit E